MLIGVREMLYRLQSEYMLRGWKGATCGIVNRKTGKAEFVSKDTYSVLLLCDGLTELDASALGENDWESLQSFIEKGYVASCEAPTALEPVQEYRRYDNRYVQSILWSVTGRCNYKCRHCYMDAPQGKLGEVSHEEALSFIDQMAECGIFTVELTGGEPFVRADIWDLIDRLVHYGIRIDQIYTNGWLVTEEVLDKLEARGLRPEFSLSFDCIGWHDWLRGVKGAEEAVLRVLEMCKRRGFPTAVEGCLHKGNIEKLHDTVKLMAQYGTRVKVGTISPTELWVKNSEGYAFTDQEYYEAMIDYIPRFFEDGMPGDVILGGLIRLWKGSSEFHIIPEKNSSLTEEACEQKRLCGAARMNAYITPEGRLLPCMPMTSWEKHVQFPRIQDIGLCKGLSDSLYMNFVNGRVGELFARNEECNSCAYKYKCCGGCRAYALCDGDDLYGCDRGQCLLWKGGYVERVRRAAEEAVEKYCK